MWRLKYIHEVKDWIVPFHKPVGEWNRQFIFQWVGIFQVSHVFETVDICYISLWHKFHNIIFKYVNLKWPLLQKKKKKKNLFRHVILCLKLLSIQSTWQVLAPARIRCLKTFDFFAFKMYYHTEAMMVQMIQLVNRPSSV